MSWSRVCFWILVAASALFLLESLLPIKLF